MSTEVAFKQPEVATSLEEESLAVADLPSFSANDETAILSEAPEEGSSTSSSLVDTSRMVKRVAAAIRFVDVPRSKLVAEWHGQVLEVRDRSFIAELRGTVGEGVRGSWEEAEIPREEVRSDDEELLRVGAFFRLSVNYELQRNTSTRRRYTDITFRRLPAYRRDELEEAAARARELAGAIRME